MTYKEHKQKADYLLEMIQKGRCYSLEQVAKKFACSKRTIKRMLTELREEGNEIYYCQNTQKFLLKN